MARDSYRLAGLGVFADSRTEYHCAGKGDGTAAGVNDCRTCEVVEAELAEPAAAPGPVAFDRVDDCRNKDGNQDIDTELCPFCHTAGHDGCSSSAEYSLEYQPSLFRNAFIAAERDVERTDLADETGVSVVHDGISDEPEKDSTHHKVDEILHQDVGRVLGSCETGFNHSESRLHEEYEHCCQQYPNRIQTVYCQYSSHNDRF